jgi:hypothetical protein
MRTFTGSWPILLLDEGSSIRDTDTQSVGRLTVGCRLRESALGILL